MSPRQADSLTPPDAIGDTSQDKTPAAEQDAARLREQARMLVLQVQKNPAFIAITASVAAFSMVTHKQVKISHALLWLGGVVLALAVRLLYARKYMRQTQAAERGLSAMPDAGRALEYLTGFAFLNGLAFGLAPLCFFGALDDAQRAMMSMVLLGLSAGGIATSAATPRVLLAYMLAALGPLIFAWTWFAGQPLISFLILFFGVTLYMFAKDNHQVFCDSFLMRYQHAQMNTELQQRNAELQQTMQALQEARDHAEEAGQAKARVLAAASHDLRQPLHALSLYSAVLAQKPEAATLEEVSKQINLSVRALSALLNALLDVSRLDAGVVQIEARSFDVKAELQRIVAEFQPLAQQKKLFLCTDLLPLRCFTDPLIFQQIARNLIENAIKYTDAGAVLVSVRNEGEQVRISVQDTGRGIPESEVSRIFEEFYQLDNPGRNRDLGLGLGLSIVKRLAELVRSRITVTSTPYEGSNFSWLAPLDRRGTGQDAAEAAPLENSQRLINPKWRILVLEDEAPIRHGMQLLLGSWGIQTHGCATREEAQDIIAKHQIQMVIADLRLQDGVSGLQVAQLLQNSQPGLAVLLVSGETDPAKLRDVADSGLPLMNKPVEPEALREHIARMLQQA
ncbi:ATP-binding protein [Massilia sp. W12]|uniref:ATP-binding protein n=1 Tax=Massilia sp. W12 TaxID=3126507 RepID=UPI0030CC2013